MGAGQIAGAAWGMCVVLCVLIAGPAAGQRGDGGAAGGGSSKPPTEAYTAYPDDAAVTVHSVELDTGTIWYVATAETIQLVGNELEAKAKVFTISYRMLNEEPRDKDALVRALRGEREEDDPEIDLDTVFPDASERPITFSFNGGPGSSSVWLHLGLFGPKRVDYVDEKGSPGPPPYEVVPNEYSLLGQSDFVFIDPVSTGYSRAEIGESAREYHGLEGDVASVAEVIRRHLTRHERWSSPKYIAGESYGTTRAAALAQHLWNAHNMALNGVILVSAVLDFATIRSGAGHDLPYMSFLPTYVATAHYHGRLSQRLQNMSVENAVEEAEEFVRSEYVNALFHGDELSESEQSRIAGILADYTGLEQEYIERANLRVSMGRFAKELLRDEGLTVGRFDSRFTGIDRDDAGEGYDYDASHAAIRANYTESFNSYIREELEWETDLPYEILTYVGPWDFGRAGEGRYVNVAERLRDAMHQQPHLRVFLASGYYDLATPHFGADLTRSHMQLGEERRDNWETHYYEGGHMMYLHEPSLAELEGDLEAFYQQAE